MRVIGATTELVDYADKSRALAAFDQSRQLVPQTESKPPVSTNDPSAETETGTTDDEQGQSSFRDQFDGQDVRYLSPREMVNLSQDLYETGVITFDEYATLAFQPELQPDYNQTIGALTGEPAEPDRKRDFVNYWEDRLAFELKYNTIDSKDVAISQRIVDVLKSLETGPTDILI